MESDRKPVGLYMETNLRLMGLYMDSKLRPVGLYMESNLRRMGLYMKTNLRTVGLYIKNDHLKLSDQYSTWTRRSTYASQRRCTSPKTSESRHTSTDDLRWPCIVDTNESSFYRMRGMETREYFLYLENVFFSSGSVMRWSKRMEASKLKR